MHIGQHQLKNKIILAPMAGVTDRPFRELCRSQGAGLAVSEMLSSNPRVWNSKKSRLRMDYHGESGIRSVQIAGAEPIAMAVAAQLCVQQGAQIVDINMGCPAKKVNKKKAGSALLPHPDLVKAILESVVDAVDIPVTLKIRTGWDPESRNGLEIAQIAQNAGIQALAVHGRTRQCLYKGEAEYDTIKIIKENVTIPVIANGDITSVEKAKYVLDYTGADAIMIGRGAQGAPWIFNDINHYLTTGEHRTPLGKQEVTSILLNHVQALHGFYGEVMGPRIARKHVGWYLQSQDQLGCFKRQFNAIDCATEQLKSLEIYLNN
ncbi:tRNA dihydrouridine synthase DusB [Psychromonas sp. Urea-02u-13]|uniref:tRNA dihydrouridine synthase DusB n=1 Tax=Psychromonas sp. Urea-02u-13 TaxID=2058326 RepID=UPI000C330051|nr:tRNA dihydrouridine synthase DusB [Psychromonas sp. Urea-02u-13]PKG40639.1 tRNA dihydrouridine synthase DusB [Psychromonas sp. Urea-02u-13]